MGSKIDVDQWTLSILYAIFELEHSETLHLTSPKRKDLSPAMAAWDGFHFRRPFGRPKTSHIYTLIGREKDEELLTNLTYYPLQLLDEVPLFNDVEKGRHPVPYRVMGYVFPMHENPN